MLINICYLIVKGMLMTDEKGNVTINNFIDPQLMHRLYEKFVLEYYIYHYNYLKPETSQIKWDVAEDEDIDFLPSMKSDITLQLNDKILIIDTKFYNHSYAIHYDKASYISCSQIIVIMAVILGLGFYHPNHLKTFVGLCSKILPIDVSLLLSLV